MATRPVRRDPDSPGAGIASNKPTSTTKPKNSNKKPKNRNNQNSNNQTNDNTTNTFSLTDTGSGSTAYFIGVEGGSDMETQGKRYQNMPAGIQQQVSGSFRPLRGVTGPKYKVGYLNSKDFAKELRGKDKDVIEFYQQRLAAAGLLDSYIPGQLDKATKAAFKEVVSMANQTGITWQKALQDVENMGGTVKADGSGAEQGQGPFKAELDDPVALRETFQKSVQEIYGGDLPDEEVNAMVDAYRSQQLAKARQKYDLEGSPGEGTVDAMTDPQSYAVAQVKAKHPQQLDRVKFQDTFAKIQQALSGQ